MITALMEYGIEYPGKYAPNLEQRIITEANFPKYKNQNQWGEVYEATGKAIDRFEGDCLELSAGTGRNTRKMLKNPEITSVLATDIDPRPLEILYANISDEYKSKLKIQSGINLLEKLPFKDNAFYGTLVAGVAHFFEIPDFIRICNELGRVTKKRLVIELETDVERTTLEGKPLSYIYGGSPDDLKIYSSEKAKELLQELFEGYNFDMSITPFEGVLRAESTDYSVPPYLLACNTIVFNMKK
jgi:ubiquinone/menaquinone biosynthesis C-methylase UbiE